MGTSDRGFASMDDSTKKDIARKGGQTTSGTGGTSSKTDNPGNFANDPAKASRAGKKGGDMPTPGTTS